MVDRLFTREFVLLDIIFILVSSTAALFVTFHQYLQGLPIDPAWYGIIIGADALTGIIVQSLVSPFLSSRNGPFFVLVGACGTAVALILYSFFTAPLPLLLVRFFHGAFFVLCVAAVITIMVASVPEGRSSQAFGIITLTRLIPFTFIPLLLGMPCLAGVSFTKVLLFGAFLLLMAPFLLLATSRKYVSVSFRRSGRTGRSTEGLVSNLRRRTVVVLLFVQLLLSCGYAMTFYYLHDFGLRTSLGNPGLFFTISMVTMILVRLFGMPVFDRVRKNVVCAWTLLVLAAGYGILPWSHVTGLVLPGILIGLGWGITFPLVAAVLFDLSRPEHRAVNTNLGLVTVQGGFLLGPLMGNILINTAGYGAMFLFCAVLSLAAVVLAVTVPMTPRRELS